MSTFLNHIFAARNQDEYRIIGENPIFAIGSRDGHERCFFISVIDDKKFEEEKIIHLSFIANDSRLEIINNLIRLTILDDECK